MTTHTMICALAAHCGRRGVVFRRLECFRTKLSPLPNLGLQHLCVLHARRRACIVIRRAFMHVDVIQSYKAYENIYQWLYKMIQHLFLFCIDVRIQKTVPSHLHVC